MRLALRLPVRYVPGMTKALQEIAHDVLELPRSQQFALAQFLLSLDGGTEEAQVDAAWDAEIRARLAAVDEGRVEALPFEEVRQGMNLRFA